MSFIPRPDERQQRVAIEPEPPVAVTVVGVEPLLEVDPHQPLGAEVDAAERRRDGLERALQPCELAGIKQVGLPFERGQGSVDGDAAHGHADEVADHDTAVGRVHRHAHHGLDVVDEPSAVATFGGTHGVGRHDACRAAHGGQLRKQHAEHGELGWVVTRRDQLAHLPSGIGTEETGVLGIEFPRGGKAEDGSRRRGTKGLEGRLSRGHLDPRDGGIPPGHAGVGNVADGLRSLGHAFRVIDGEAEREERAPVERPRVVSRSGGLRESVAVRGQRVRLDRG
jgi:hypothetical protein